MVMNNISCRTRDLAKHTDHGLPIHPRLDLSGEGGGGRGKGVQVAHGPGVGLGQEAQDRGEGEFKSGGSWSGSTNVCIGANCKM